MWTSQFRALYLNQGGLRFRGIEQSLVCDIKFGRSTPMRGAENALLSMEPRLRLQDDYSRLRVFSCTRIVSVPRHERPSTLSCFDYDVGVRILYKSFGFPLPLGEALVAD